ncbi:MAG: LamG-like jellyroll fold domain-containing protein [Alloprevotella sp.]
MKNTMKWAFLALGVLPAALSAQSVDRKKYPDYSSEVRCDWTLLTPAKKVGTKAVQTRPDHCNNAETLYFPPVFNQAGGSCGSASRICYMFSHEMNSFRNLNGKDPKNYYPSHFVWLLTNGNSGKDEFVQYVGVPSAQTYGGQTYSALFGYQEETYNDFGWMTGYEKWYEAMHNRMLRPTNFPISVQTEEGREAVKNWLWNHNGDTDFHSGGIVGIGVASALTSEAIPSTPANTEAGVVGKKYVKKWGTSVDHALTVVGYDDRIEFDLNGNGVYGEESADEKGAWIIVNSWGPYWANSGFIYCPYAHAGAWFNADGTMGNSWWQPEVYKVRKNYRPLRTIKLKMDYSRRSELYLTAGVSENLNATEPDGVIAFEHFKYAGDGNGGNTVPAPEIPMLGRWADGNLHTEPMEFGYDLTDLSAGYDQSKPLKYFFTIRTKSTAVGEGHIREASIIDYDIDPEGIETPFVVGETPGTLIQNAGKSTTISVIVPGRGIYAPQNARIADGVLLWEAPVKSANVLTAYKVYQNGKELAELSASTKSYTLPADAEGTFEVTAVYGSVESAQVSAEVPYFAEENQAIDLRHSGFTIPGVFSPIRKNVTIEFWMKCHSLADWNQSAGPGWGQFMFHANADGTFTAGWTTSNRCNATGALKTEKWQHIAIVVDGGKMSVYVDGAKKASCNSAEPGVGGFGDLTFSATASGGFDAEIDELRIWNKTFDDFDVYGRNVEAGGAGLIDKLLVYYKGDVIRSGGETKLRDYGPNRLHAPLANDNFSVVSATDLVLTSSTLLDPAIVQPTEGIYVGIPVKFTATAKRGAETVKWTVPDAGMTDVAVISPEVTFRHTGEQTVKVVVADKNGNTAEDEITVNVLAAPAPTADFSLSKSNVAAGERISFIPSSSLTGYLYEWSMPGADNEKVNTPMAAAIYQREGTYDVTLTVTSPDGQKASATKQVSVTAVAPQSDFRVNNSIVVKGEAVELYDLTKFGPNAWKWDIVSDKFALTSADQNPIFKPEHPGIYNISLTTTNEVGSSTALQAKALTVCNAESGNGLTFSNGASYVRTTTVPMTTGLKTLTVDWWMRPNALADVGNGIGGNASTFLLKTNSNAAMSISTKNLTTTCDDGFVIPNEWHHYAVTFNSGTVKFYRDGVLFQSKTMSTTTLSAPSIFYLGSSVAPMSGTIDEFRVWNKVLTEAQIQSFCNQPIADENIAAAEADNALKLYYRFDQSSGNVVDATSNGNTGTRVGFGPDGDAWSDSKGVFCLNFEESGVQDITSGYLVNYKASFKDDGTCVSAYNNNRFMGLASWTKVNPVEQSTYTGAHVDYGKHGDFTITTQWDGFEKELKDHQVYQTVHLPAGTYKFTAVYDTDYEGESSGCYLVAMLGNSFPLTSELTTSALAYAAMQPKSATISENSVTFSVKEDADISLGILANMSGEQCMAISSFSLQKMPITVIEGVPEGITSPTTGGKKSGKKHSIDGRRITRPVSGQPYIEDGRKRIAR